MTHPTKVASTGAPAASSFRFKRAHAALVDELRQRCGGELRKGTLIAEHGTTAFRLSFLPKGRGYVVSVACGLAGRFRVTRKGALDRRMEAFVPAVPFRSCDPRFDRDFNVQTRDLQVTSAVFERQANCDLVRQLFDEGVYTVHLDGESIKAIGRLEVRRARPSPEDILGLVEALAPLAEEVTDFAARTGVRPAPKHDPVVVGSWVTLGMLGVLGFAMVIAGSVEYTLAQPARFLLPCAIYGLLPVVPLVFVLTYLVQHRTSPYGLVRGLAGVSMLVVPLFVSGTLLLANGVLDPTPAQEHVVTVVNKKVRRDKNGRHYNAGLAAWWTEGDVRWVRVSKSTYERLQPGVSHMRVLTHPGELGYEWIESFAVLP